MIVEGFYSTRELSEKYGISTRTIHNRLAHLRESHPDSFVVQKIFNGKPIFLYKAEFITDDLITSRTYIRKAPVVPKIDFDMPPVTITGDDGKKYNLIGLKALLKVLTERSAFEKMTASLLVFWICLIVYFWRML